MAVLLGSFTGSLLIPALLLFLARRRPSLAWLRIVAVTVAACGAYAGWNGRVADDAGATMAVVVAIIWALLDSRQRHAKTKAA